MHEDAGQGLADDVGASADDDVLALRRVAGAVKQLYDAGGGGGVGTGLAPQQAAQVHGRDAVDVLGGIDGVD